MAQEWLFSEHFQWEGKCYLVHVYRHAQRNKRCSHMAETALAPDDRIISDGTSPEDVLHKHQLILPLAIMSRALL